MFQLFCIKNFVLFEEVLFDFDVGFMVVIGEMGVGKSILLGVFSFFVGECVDKIIICQGVLVCEVEVLLFFKYMKVIDILLVEFDLFVCEDGLLILKCSVLWEKVFKIIVNGGLVMFVLFQWFGEVWVDFYGLSEFWCFLKESC